MKRLSTNLILLFICLFISLPIGAQTGFDEQETGMTGSLRGLDVVSRRVVWVSGAKGEFSVTRNGGYTWFQDTVPGAGKLDFRDVQGFSAKVALLMSAGPGKGSAIFRTENGGKSWVLTYQNTDEKAFFDGMDFFDNSHGLLIGDPVDEKPYLLETKDGGLIWNRLIPEKIPDLIPGEYAFAASGTSLDACSDGTCYLATGGSVARVFRSADRGKNWEVTTLPVLQGDLAAGAFSIAMGPGHHLAVAGGHYQKMTITGANIALSEDNGRTWTVPAGAALVPFMECIRWIDPYTLVACGPPGLWMSTDSGKTWVQMSPDGFHTMEVSPDQGTIWLAGNKGKVVKWR
jgi:photosystem II stability/assembly factor-like uncharacterized protein